MKQFLSFTKKEFLHIFRDTWTMMIILVLPVIMMLLFGYAVTTEIRDTNIGILDNSRDEISNRLIDKLDESEYFSVVKVFKSNSEIDKAFRRNEISMAIVIENDFSKKLITGQNPKIQIIADASDPNHAKTLVNYASGVIAQSLMQESKSTNPLSQINTEIKLLYNPLMKSSYNFVPGVMGFIIIIVCAMMTSISIVKERERGSMELLLVSPVKPITIILSKVAPYFFISLINILTIFLVSYFIMGVPIKGSIFWIFLLCIVYILVSLSLGILVSTIAKTQLVALVISAIILLMPSMLLSGMMFDISSMPLILQAIAQVMPAKWFISAIRKLMIMGVDVRFVLNEFLVLFSMGVVLILISLKKYKNRLE
jgi:ABC-2 type transport system permease protein